MAMAAPCLFIVHVRCLMNGEYMQRGRKEEDCVRPRYIPGKYFIRDPDQSSEYPIQID